MPTLQEKISSPGTWLRPFPMGKGADLPAVRQDLATQCHVAAVADCVWRDRRGAPFGRSTTLAPRARWRHFGAGLVAAAVCVHFLARNVCIAGQFSVEMRIA